MDNIESILGPPETFRDRYKNQIAQYYAENPNSTPVQQVHNNTDSLTDEELLQKLGPADTFKSRHAKELADLGYQSESSSPHFHLDSSKLKTALKDLGILGASIGAGILTEGAAAPIIEPIAAGAGEGLGSALVGGLLSGGVGGAAGNTAADTLESFINHKIPKLHDLVHSAKFGAELGGPLGAAGETIASMIPSSIKSYFGVKAGETSPDIADTISENMKSIPEGVKVPLGGLSGSYPLKEIDAYVRSSPFSTGEKPYHALGGFLSETLDKLRSPDYSDIDSLNQDAYGQLSKVYQGKKAATSNAYQRLADAAHETTDGSFDPAKYHEAVRSSLEEINPKLVNSEAKRTYGPLLKMVESYRDTDIPDFKTANIVGQVLNDSYRSNLSPENFLARRHINKIKEGLESAIDDNASAHPELAQLRSEAKAARIDQAKMETGSDGKRTPFFNIYNRPGATDSNKFIDKNFRSSESLKDLLEHLSPKTRKDILTYKMSPTGRESMARQISNLARLRPAQRELLLSPSDNILTSKALNVSSMFPKATHPSFVPQTGLTGAKMLETNAITSDVLGSPSLGLKSVLGTPILSRGIAHLLRSDALRDASQKVLRGQKIIGEDNPLLNLLLSNSIPRHAVRTAITQEGNQ